MNLLLDALAWMVFGTFLVVVGISCMLWSYAKNSFVWAGNRLADRYPERADK